MSNLSNRTQACRIVAAGLCVISASVLAQAGAGGDPLGLRAQSRLGYGPSASMLQAGEPRTWATQQLELAALASRSSPSLAPELAVFNAPLPSLFAQFREERAARRDGQARTAVAPANPSAAAMAAPAAVAARPAPSVPGQPSMEAGANDYPFSQRMARAAAAWRVLSCSRPDLENPLLARMTEFWFNHLNVFAGKGSVRPFVGHYVVNVIRQHALGRFEDLLLASAKHPAMLFYLDQAQSVADGSTGPLGQSRGLNENYARELMELHTLGAQGGYSQADVRQLARILTGWTVDPNDGSGFRFAERLHDRGDKVLLGRRFSSGGIAEGEEAIRMLARHPSTARRVSQRLAEFFVADQPSAQLVNRLAGVFTSSQGNIKATMQALIESPEFWQAENRLFKTPLDYACSVMAAAGGVKDQRDVALTLGFLAGAGQPVHGWRTPDGYKTDAATWMAPEALTRRTDFALTIGRRTEEPASLRPFIQAATWERIAREPEAMRAGLVLASPEFMYK